MNRQIWKTAGGYVAEEKVDQMLQLSGAFTSEMKTAS